MNWNWGELQYHPSDLKPFQAILDHVHALEQENRKLWLLCHLILADNAALLKDVSENSNVRYSETSK